MKRYSIKRTILQENYDWISVEAESEDDALLKSERGEGEIFHDEIGFEEIQNCEIEEIEEEVEEE